MDRVEPYDWKWEVPDCGILIFFYGQNGFTVQLILEQHRVRGADPPYSQKSAYNVWLPPNY